MHITFAIQLYYVSHPVHWFWWFTGSFVQLVWMVHWFRWFTGSARSGWFTGSGDSLVQLVPGSLVRVVHWLIGSGGFLVQVDSFSRIYWW